MSTPRGEIRPPQWRRAGIARGVPGECLSGAGGRWARRSRRQRADAGARDRLRAPRLTTTNPLNSYETPRRRCHDHGMAEQTFPTTTSRLSSVDRYSPAVLLSLALLFGLLAQYLFYGVALGINLGIGSLALLAAARRLRPADARLDRSDRWIAPAAILFAFLPAIRTDLMLLLFDAPATVVLVTMAAVSFAGVPLTRRALDVLIVLGLVVASRILAGGAVLLAAFPELGRPLSRRTGGRGLSVGVGIALPFPFLRGFALLFARADAVFSGPLPHGFSFKASAIREPVGEVTFP